MSDTTTTETTRDDSWMRDPDELEKFITVALKRNDLQGVEYGLQFLALADPKRAQKVVDTLRAAVHMASGGDVAVQIVPA